MKASEVVARPIINCKLDRILNIFGRCLAVQSDFFYFSQNFIEATETLTLENILLFKTHSSIQGGGRIDVHGDSYKLYFLNLYSIFHIIYVRCSVYVRVLHLVYHAPQLCNIFYIFFIYLFVDLIRYITLLSYMKHRSSQRRVWSRGRFPAACIAQP